MLNNIEMKIETVLREKTAIFKMYNDAGVRNVVNESLIDALSSEINKLQDLYKDDKVNSLIITGSENNGFLNGIHLKFLRESENRNKILSFCEKAQNVFSALRNMPFPSIAAINGECIAGGFELALACQYRILADSRKNIVGLPNIELGLIPGLSGSSRLPRLIGLERAIDIITNGRTFLPQAALKFGLVDEVVPEELQMDIAIRAIKHWEEKLKYRKKFLHKIHKASLLKRFKRTYTGIFLTRKLAERRLHRKNNLIRSVSGKILDVLVDASFKVPESVFKVEREAFVDLLLQPKPESYAKNLVESLFMRNELENLNKLSGIDFGIPKKVAIVGAGKVGRELAYFLASKQISVKLIDKSSENLTKAMLNAKKLADDEAKIGIFNKYEARRIIDYINPGLDITGFQHISLVFEAEQEVNINKRKTLEMIENAVNRETLIVSCTSSLSITEISRNMINPERFVGVHFAYPMLLKPLAEIVKAKRTSNLNFVRAYCWLLENCRIPVITSDKIGFLLNRLQIPYLVEAVWLVLEGASPALIDTTMEKFGMTVGPCKTIDELGIQEFNNISKNMSEAYQDRFFTSGLTTRMAERGFIGKDSGAGFYKYSKNADGGEMRIQNPQLKSIARGLRLVMNMIGAPRHIDSAEILARLTSVLVNEAAFALEEKIVDRARILDTASIYGIGFPAFYGGLLRYADNYGISRIVESLDNWQKTPPEFASVYWKMPLDFKEQKKRENGRRFAVSSMLRQFAECATKFYSVAELANDTNTIEFAQASFAASTSADEPVTSEIPELESTSDDFSEMKQSVQNSDETVEEPEVNDISIKTVEEFTYPVSVDESQDVNIEPDNVISESDEASEYLETEFFVPAEPTFIPDDEAIEPVFTEESTNMQESEAVSVETDDFYVENDVNNETLTENGEDFEGFDDDSDPFADMSSDFIQDAEALSMDDFETQDLDSSDSDSDFEKNSDD